MATQTQKFQITDDQVWYIIINNQTRGPLSIRDLDVLLRTNEIHSRTFAWKTGMKDWKTLYDIEEIKESILQSSKEIIEIQKKRESIFDKNTAGTQVKNADTQQKEDQADKIIQNNDENALEILEATVENFVKNSFHQTQDGKWNIYDEVKGEWTIQDTQPIQMIKKMKNQMFNKLKSELFFQEKGNRKKKTYAHNEAPAQEEIPLTQEQLLKRQKNKKKTRRAAEKKKEKWYNAKINTFIYISGLPFDITEEQLKEFASKAGVLRIDLNTCKQKIKIYKDENGLPKGDAAISFARQQSVDIAIQNLNNSEIRSGFQVKVEKAKFNQKQQEYKPRELKKQTLVKKIQAKKNQQRKLAWDDDIQEKGDGLKIVILKHIFDQTLSQLEVEQIKKQIQEEVKRIGEIQRIKFYEQHIDGPVEVKFKQDIDAEKCIQALNGRFYDGREIQCDYWDGQTDFKRDPSTLVTENARLSQFGEELEEGLNPIPEKSEENNEDFQNKL